MPGTLVPDQMFDHTLVVTKGAIAPRRLEISAPPKAAEAIRSGMCVSLDSNGELVKGCPVGAVDNKPMPLFATGGQDDFDVNSDKGNLSGGVMTAVVATGAFEVQTTEFVGTSTYTPNDLLKATTAGTVDVLGTLPYLTATAVGVVSRGTDTNRDGKSVLSFWTVYVPAGADS